ncbi:hypothetical protein D9M70_628730 [compost metagenome]
MALQLGLFGQRVGGQVFEVGGFFRRQRRGEELLGMLAALAQGKGAETLAAGAHFRQDLRRRGEVRVGDLLALQLQALPVGITAVGAVE